MSRNFDLKPATRETVPLIVGIVGASGSGKTYSALRLATGIQRVVGGKIGFIDTEGRRGLFYADDFKFDHLDFRAPFDPLSYLDAIETCAARGAKTIVVDGQSFEHDGSGGVLEMHAAEQQRLATAWRTSLDKVNMSAWQKPKADRRKLLNAMIQMGVNFVLCFRAKEKMDLKGDKPKVLGWMPIAGEEFVYESTVTCLLYPGSNGVPAWHPTEMGEKATIKMPGKLAHIFADKQPLSEEMGERLARWAAGDVTSGKGDTSPPPPNGERAALEREIAALVASLKIGGAGFKERFGKTRGEMSIDELIETVAKLTAEMERP